MLLRNENGSVLDPLGCDGLLEPPPAGEAQGEEEQEQMSLWDFLNGCTFWQWVGLFLFVGLVLTVADNMWRNLCEAWERRSK